MHCRHMWYSQTAEKGEIDSTSQNISECLLHCNSIFSTGTSQAYSTKRQQQIFCILPVFEFIFFEVQICHSYRIFAHKAECNAFDPFFI